jgi:hypothetical protein
MLTESRQIILKVILAGDLFDEFASHPVNVRVKVSHVRTLLSSQASYHRPAKPSRGLGLASPDPFANFANFPTSNSNCFNHLPPRPPLPSAYNKPSGRLRESEFCPEEADSEHRCPVFIR